jgi:alkyl sulfatase BDS1-like metallo-beta-lactamase superfamily hydrolase
MEAVVLSETARLHLKLVAQTSGFEVPVASAVYTRSPSRIFMGVLFDDDDDDDISSHHRHRRRRRRHSPNSYVDR